MARDRSVTFGAETYQGSPNSLIASARTLQGASITKAGNGKTIKTADWQNRAWNWYDNIGEFHYAVNWVGNTLSRARLKVVKNGAEVTSGPAYDLLQQFFGGRDGQTEMLRQSGIHFTVAGDCYYVGEPGKVEGDPDKWRVIAAIEMTGNGSLGYKAEKRDIPSNALVIRNWKKHPRKSEESDCPTRAVLPVLSQLYGLTQHVAAQLDSRLAGAGILTIPSEMTLGVGPSNPPATADENSTTGPASGADSLMETLRLAMVTAIGNREDASALVPIIVQAPGEHLDKINHITFFTALDQAAEEMRKETVGRLGLGMDMPPEILQGVADMNHWSSWQVEEAAIKAHTEPLLDVITEGITTNYLRPGLLGLGIEDIMEFSIVADTTEMRLRPNRSKEAQELREQGILSEKAVVRENGFDEDDIMTDEEKAQFYLEKTAIGSATPAMMIDALEQLGVHIDPAAAEAERVTETISDQTGTNPDGTVHDARPDPSLLEHPVRNLPDPKKSKTNPDANAASAEAAVFRALERVGNRIKNQKGFTMPEGVDPIDLYQHVDIPAADFGTMLEGAWGLCERMSIKPPVVQQLDDYTRSLLATKKPHNRDLMESFLKVTEGA
jgi:hypothetical protein